MVLFKELPVHIRRHEGAGHHAQIISKPKDIRDITHSLADFFQCIQMNFHERFEQSFHIGLFDHQVHEKNIHAAEKSTPLKQITSAHDHKRTV